MLNRRRFLAASTAVAAAGLDAFAAKPAARLVLLGTKGGPRPGPNRLGSSQALVVGGEIFVVDCGDGVASQLRRAGLQLRNVRHVFLTHMHSDHIADYGNLLYFAWYSGMKKKLHAWGPPEITSLTKAALDYHAHDVAIRVEDEGRRRLAPLVAAHPMKAAGEVVRHGVVRVRAALVDHPPLVPSFAYRFDTPAGSVVISGDTAPSDALVELARGADILVHEVVYKPRLDAFLDRLPSANTRFRRHLLRSHTTTKQVGKIAKRAGVKKLVLSHLVPGSDDVLTDEVWRRDVARDYDGEIVVGRDLMNIPLS